METLDRGEIGVGGDTKNNDDIAVNEVIVAESSGEESGLVEVETVCPGDMFDFCMDQLVNASSHEARQEARDLLVDNFDEFSLHEFDLLNVIVEKGKQSRVDHELPSTSQVSSTQIRPNRKNSQKRLDYLRQCREDLKKNRAKHQKALQNMRDYYKQRMERMSEDDKKAFRQRGRVRTHKYYYNLSAEKKRERIQKNYQQQKATASDKFMCKFSFCGKSFMKDKDLIKHERIHLRIKPFMCTWPNCEHSSEERTNVTQHVRTKHFKLPRTKQQQQRLNIIDTRNPNDYVQVNNELVKRRLE